MGRAINSIYYSQLFLNEQAINAPACFTKQVFIGSAIEFGAGNLETMGI